MRVIMTGATGQIGIPLARQLVNEGHDVVCWTRNPKRVQGRLPAKCTVVAWDPNAVKPEDLAGADALIHLAGENIADGRWSEKRKQQIRQSRTDSTKSLVKAIGQLDSASRPKHFIGASAIGYYGDRGNTLLDEAAAPGDGFLAEVCAAWEQETSALDALGVRVALARIGVVLERNRGMLEPILPLFQMGIAGRLGSGRQWMSWIHVDDVVALLLHLLKSPSLHGVWNAVAPEPVTNREFTSALAKALNRPAILPVPRPMLYAVYGELASLMFASVKADATAIVQSGFSFKYPDIMSALSQVTSSDESVLIREQRFPRSREDVFSFFGDPRNLEKITPDFLNFAITELPDGALQEGSIIRYKLQLHGIPLRWTTRISDWTENESFVDEQTSGPYALWHHTHHFEDDGEGTLMTDVVRYRLPVGAVATLLAGSFIKKDLDRIFSYRFDTMSRWLA